MPNPRPRQDPELLRTLKAGTDRGGQPRSWEEVAELRGITRGHAIRMAADRPPHMPPRRWIDPRQIIPELKEILSDEDVDAWNEDPRCLCGCGEATLPEGGNKGKVPYGAYRMFRSSHEKRMPWVREKQFILNRDQERRRKNSVTQRADNINGLGFAEDIQEWRLLGNGTLVDLARLSGVSESHLRSIFHGRVERIRKVTAAKLHIAMGQPLRPEIADAYRKWKLTHDPLVSPPHEAIPRT